MKQTLPTASTRFICRVLEVARSALYRPLEARSRSEVTHSDTKLMTRIKELIQVHPTYGYRRIWARLRYGDQRVVNKKTVRRLMRRHGWMVQHRPATPRLRVQQSRSVTTRSNERWALDATPIDCGDDGWAHLIAGIDGHDRTIVGWEFAMRGRANEAERALEMACLTRFGTVRPAGQTPVIRSDNGVIVQRRRFREACQFYRLRQEYITPYTPEQHGVIERWFRSLQEACVWQQQFRNFAEAKVAIRTWIDWYHRERPHQALGSRSPEQFSSLHQKEAA